MNIVNLFFRLFLTFNATSLILVVFLVKEEVTVNNLNQHLENLPAFISYIIYFLVPVIFTFLSVFLAKSLGDDSIELEEKQSSPIIAIEQANNAYLPSYLGYFFVALSVPFYDTLIFVFAILFIFTFLSQTLYFNPLFLFFGFHFYYLTTENNIKIFLITKRILKNPKDLEFPELKRINDFTFIEIEKYESSIS
jgi:pilus assembly protein TadC